MDWARKSLMELDRSGDGERIAWADIAKAFSIILLVLWSLYGTSIYFNQMLIPVRMPTFFFVSGLFAYGVIARSDTTTFFRNKVGNLIYLYVLWTVIWFLSTELVANLWWGREFDPAPGALFSMLWEPIIRMWFFYGLALAFGLAYLCRNAPVGIVLVLSLVAYVVVVVRGNWFEIPFVDKVIRLFPYFWIGLVFRPWIAKTVNRYWQFWPVPVVAFAGLSYWMMSSPWQQFPPLSFLVTIIGISAFLGLSAQAAQFRWSWILTVIGGSTLYIYAMDYMTIFYLDRVMYFVGLPVHPEWTFLPVVVLFGTLFGRFCANHPRLRWLFAAPWAPYKPPSKINFPGSEATAPVRRAVPDQG